MNDLIERYCMLYLMENADRLMDLANTEIQLGILHAILLWEKQIKKYPNQKFIDGVPNLATKKNLDADIKILIIRSFFKSKED